MWGLGLVVGLGAGLVCLLFCWILDGGLRCFVCVVSFGDFGCFGFWTWWCRLLGGFLLWWLLVLWWVFCVVVWFDVIGFWHDRARWLSLNWCFPALLVCLVCALYLVVVSRGFDLHGLSYAVDCVVIWVF